MVTKAETVLTRVGRIVRGLLAYVIDLLVIYLILSFMFGDSKEALDYTIVRGVCFSCIDEMFGILSFVAQLVVILFVLISFSLYEIVCKLLLKKTLGETLMCIRFASFEGDVYRPLFSWFLRASWTTVMIVIPFGYKVILFPLTVIALLYIYISETT